MEHSISSGRVLKSQLAFGYWHQLFHEFFLVIHRVLDYQPTVHPLMFIQV